MKMKLSLLALAAAFAGTLSAGSVVLTSNLAEPLDGANTIGTSTWFAISFFTDGNSYSLTSATLVMELGDGGVVTSVAPAFSPAAVADIPELDLYSDNGGNVGSELATFTDPITFTTSLDDNVFTISGVTVSPNTTYWLVLKALSGIVSWGFPTDDNGTGIGFTDTFTATTNGGATWDTPVAGDEPNLAEVDANLSGVPEPSTAWLVIPGFLLLAAIRARRTV